MSEPTRYDISELCDGYMSPRKDGEYVEYDDYAKLQAERDEARAALRLIYCHINSDGIPILRNTEPGDFQIIAKAYRNADPFPKIQFPKL